MLKILSVTAKINQVFFILATGNLSVNRIDFKAPNLKGPPWINLGAGTPSCSTPRLPKSEHFKSRFSNGKKQNGGHFVRFSNGPDHSKTEPFKMAVLS